MITPKEALIERLIRFHADRQRAGLRCKYARMAEGPFEFFRGTDLLFVDSWPALRPRKPGPAILICGDLHLENFGAFPTDDGDYHFDINDFDEAAVAPCSFDLVRCATSILLAAESWRLTPTQGTGMVLSFLDSYRETALADAALTEAESISVDLGSVAGVLDATRRGSRKQLLRRYTKQRGDGTWRFRCKSRGLKRVGANTLAAIIAAVEEFGREKGWHVLDVARRFSGIGSLGLRRYPLLIAEAVGDAPEPQFLTLKETIPSVLVPIADAQQPSYANEAERSVAAQRQLQGKPTAGLGALEIGARAFRIRAMIPEENRSSLYRLQKSPPRLREAVAAAGRVTARSHWRGSHVANGCRAPELRDWVASPALESVLAAAVRFADWIQRDYAMYVEAYRDGAFEE